MKKILAIAITVMMLLTMAVVMPVSADTATEVNLIKNGSFEMDTDGDTSLEYWTQLNENAKMKAWKITDFRFNPPTDGVNVAYAKAANIGISQTVDLTDTDYYENWDKYGFILTFESYKGSGWESVGNMHSMVTMTTADGESVSQKYPHTFNDENLAGGTNGGVFTNTKDLTELMDQLSAPAKTITITMQSGTELSVDNIKLTPIKVTRAPNLILNGSFEEDVDPKPGQSGPPSGATADYDLAHWTQINESAKMVAWATAPTTIFNPATDGSNVVYVTGAGIKGIYQTINFADDSEYYRNQSDYNFVLSFDTYSGGTSSRTAVITLTTAEGATVTGTFDHTFKASDLVAARMYRNTFDFTELFSSLALPAKSITVRMETNGELCIDNVKLSPYPAEVSTGENNMLINASFENVVDGNLDSWTVVDYDYELASLCTSEEKIIPDGSNAIKLTNIQGVMVNDAPKSYGGMVKQNVTLEKGKYYQLKYKYVAAAAGSALITISNTSGWAKLLEETAPATSVWAFDKKWIKAEEDMVAEIAMRCHPDLEGAAVYYDDISLIEAVDPDTDNLVFNGSFEVDSNGDTIITGWKQMHASDLYAIKNSAQMGAAADGKYMIQHGTGTVATDAVLAQTVEINNYDYENMKNYDYELGFSIGYLWGGYPTVYVDYYFEDDTNNFTNRIIMRRSQAEMDQFTAAPEQLNDVYYLLATGQSAHVTFNLGDYYGDITSPLKSIRIRLDVQNWGAAYDNVTLRCLDNINTVEIVDGSGAVVKDVVTNAEATYTAKATYYGADAGAMSYIAVYTKDANGVLRLAKVANATLTSGVANTNATLSGVNAVAGTTVVKAFILGTEINPVISAIAD